MDRLHNVLDVLGQVHWRLHLYCLACRHGDDVRWFTEVVLGVDRNVRSAGITARVLLHGLRETLMSVTLRRLEQRACSSSAQVLADSGCLHRSAYRRGAILMSDRISAVDLSRLHVDTLIGVHGLCHILISILIDFCPQLRSVLQRILHLNIDRLLCARVETTRNYASIHLVEVHLVVVAMLAEHLLHGAC